MQVIPSRLASEIACALLKKSAIGRTKVPKWPFLRPREHNLVNQLIEAVSKSSKFYSDLDKFDRFKFKKRVTRLIGISNSQAIL